MPTYYARLMAKVLAEMPAPTDEADPRIESAVTRAAVLLGREAHWSNAEAMRCLAEMHRCSAAMRETDAEERRILGMPEAKS